MLDFIIFIVSCHTLCQYSVMVPCYIGVGEVVAVGEGDASGLTPGDRVVAAPGPGPSGTWYVLCL